LHHKQFIAYDSLTSKEEAGCKSRAVPQLWSRLDIRTSQELLLQLDILD